MSSGCSALNKVTIKAEGTIPNNALLQWLWGVAASGTISYKQSSLTLPDGHSGVPSGWTKINITN